MDIIVCIKQVPDTTEVKIDQKTGRLIREGVPSIINPEDKNALEEALRIKEGIKEKDDSDSKVTVITMGPPQAEVALRESLAMGADEAILLCDLKFAGSDTWATANALKSAIKTIGKYDIILCGRQAIDGDTAQVGPQLAESLQIPQVTYAQKIGISGKKARIERELEDGYEIIETSLPALITCIAALNQPRYPSLKGIDDSFNKIIKNWAAKDINCREEEVGIKASPTNVKKTFSPAAKGHGTMLKGNVKEMAHEMIEKLKEKEIIQKF